MDAEFAPDVQTFEGVELQPKSDTASRLLALSNQIEITERWRTLCEAALAVKIGASLNGMELVILGGFILGDEEFSTRLSAMTAEWLEAQVAKHGEDFLIMPGRFTLEENAHLDLELARRMTKQEKVALRTRLQVKSVLPKG